MPFWVYAVAAIVGSFVGAVLDYVLYAEGGSIFLKIGFVAGPAAIWLIAKRRQREPEEPADQQESEL